MANHVKDMTIRDTDWSTVLAAALANVLHAVEGCAPVQAVCSAGRPRRRATQGARRAGPAYRQLADLYEAAARWTGDPWFGLHRRSERGRAQLRSPGISRFTTATLEQAFEVLARYLSLWTTSAGFRIERLAHDDRGRLDLLRSHRLAAAPRLRDVDDTAAANAGGQLHAGRWRPREVHFRHGPPDDTSEHARLLRAPVWFGMPRNLIARDAASGATPVASADPVLHELLRDPAGQRLCWSRHAAVDPRRHRCGDRGSCCRPGTRGADRRASLGLGARTLERRLDAGGAMARSLLTAGAPRSRNAPRSCTSDLPISEIATARLRLAHRAPSRVPELGRRWPGGVPASVHRTRSWMRGPGRAPTS